MAFEGLNFDVGLNARPFTDGIKTMQSQAVSFDNTVKQIGRTLMGVFGAVSVVATLKKSIELWGEQEQAMMKLSIAAQRFTRDAQGTYDRVSKLSGNLQHLTGIGNETYQSVAALGLSLGITEEKIENATTAAALLSQVTGMDLNSAMKNLAKTQAGLTGELGEALPFLRELTQEQLRNGEAIDLVIKKYDGFAEQLSGTTQVAMKRFWSALGDVGEALGKSFNPLIQKAADWMEDFSSKIEKPTDILKTLKDTIKAGYEELGPFGKAVVGVGAAFLTLKVAGTAWSLLSQVVVAGGSLIVNAFKTIFSWPFMLIAGLYTLRVAWDHDWLGIQGTVEHVWGVVEPIFAKLKGGLTTATTWMISLVWGGVQWVGEKIALTYETIKDWVLEELAFGKSPLEIVVDAAKIVGGVVWDGLKWIGGEIVDIVTGRSPVFTMLRLVSDWAKGELAEEIETVIEIGKVIGGLVWQGLSWMGEKIVSLATSIYDFVMSEIDSGFEQTVEIAKVIGGLVWDGLKWVGEKVVSVVSLVADFVAKEIDTGFEQTIEVAKVIGGIIWSGLKWIGEKVVLGLKMFEKWARDELGIPETQPLVEVFLEMVKIAGTAVWSGLQWIGQKVVIGAKEVYDWVSDNLDTGLQLVVDVAEVVGGVAWAGLKRLGEWTFDLLSWAASQLPAVAEATITVGKVAGGVLWDGLKWLSGRTFDLLVWAVSQLPGMAEVTVRVGKVLGGVLWAGLQKTGEWSFDLLSWAVAQFPTLLEVAINVGEVTGEVLWKGLKKLGEWSYDLLSWAVSQLPGPVQEAIKVGSVVGEVLWSGLEKAGEWSYDLALWVAAQLPDVIEMTVNVGKVAGEVIWSGLKWAGQKTVSFIDELKKKISEAGISDEEREVSAGKVTGILIWTGLKWTGEQIIAGLSALESWARGQLGVPKEAPLSEIVLDMVKVTGTAVWSGLQWVGQKVALGAQQVYDWASEGLEKGFELTIEVAKVLGGVAWAGLRKLGEWTFDIAIWAKEEALPGMVESVIEVGRVAGGVSWIGLKKLGEWLYDVALWAKEEALPFIDEKTLEVAKITGGVIWQGLVKLGEWSYDVAVWAKNEALPAMAEATIEVGKVVGGVSWQGLKWIGSQIAIGFDTLKKWVYSELGLDKYGATSNILIEVAKVFGGLGWLGLRWAGEKIVLGYETLKSWTEEQFGTTPKEIVVNVAKVVGTAIWEGVKWIDDKLPKIDLGADDEQKVDQGSVDVVVSAIAKIASWQWRGFVWLTEKASFGLDWIADQIRPKINIEVNGDDNSGFDIGDITVFAKGVAKVFSMKWEAVKWLWTKVTQSTFIEDLKNRIKKSSGIDDEVEVTWKDLLVRGFGSIGSAVWDGLTWFAEGPVHAFADWVREKIGMSEAGEMKVNLGDDIKVILSGAVSGATWLVDWVKQGIGAATEWLQDVGAVLRRAVEGVEMSAEDIKLYETTASFGVKLGEFIGAGIKAGLNLLDIIQSALAGVIAEMTGSKEVGQVAGTAIPLFFTAKWLMTPIATLTPFLVAAMGFAGLKPLAFGTFGVMVALKVAQDLSTGEAEWQDIGARFVAALAVGMGIGAFLGSPSAGVLTFELLMLVKVEKFIDKIGGTVKDIVDAVLFPEFVDLPVSEKMEKTIRALEKLDQTLDRPADNLATWLITVDEALGSFYKTFPTKVELNQMGELEQRYYMAVLEYAQALEASSNAILDAAGDLEATAQMIENMRQIVVPIPGKAEGGYISGPGGPKEDRIPALLSNGEFVVNAKSTEKWLPFLKAINAQGFADGGIASLKDKIRGFADGGITKFATGTATKIDVGSVGGGSLTWWDTILNTLMSVVGDYAETAKKDFGMIKNALGDLLRSVGLDIDAPLNNLNKLQSELDGLTVSTSDTGDTVEDFMTAMFKGYSKINKISEVLSEGKIDNVNRQLAFLDTAMNDLEKQFMEGTIQLGEYTERMTYLKNLTDSFSDSLGDLKKKIERSSIVGDSSEIFKVDENTGELVSVFAKLRPGMEGLTDVVGNLATAGEMFAVGLLNQVVNLEAINMLLNPITTILTGVMEILGPIINLLKPLGDALISIGRVFALTFNLFGQGLLVLQPFFKALGWLGVTISYVADQIVLFVDGIFVWLSKLPFIGGLFSPLLTEDQRVNMDRSISERMESYELPQSSTGQTFQAGSSQHITNNYYFEFKDNDILTEDDESARRFADLIYKNLRDRGVELQVG